MRLRAFILFSLLTVPALPAQSGRANVRDTALEEMDAKLQEQRAAALRTRLVLGTDELTKLQAHYAAAGDAAAAALLKSEVEDVQEAIKQLANIAQRQADPPAPGELAEGEQLSPAALAARRIDRLLAKFAEARSQPRSEPGTPAPAVRSHTLKMDKARLRSSDDEGDYWSHPGNYALWAVPELAPGRYEVILRYTAGPESGGKVVLKIAGETLAVTVPRGEKGGREQRLPAGTVTIKEPGADVRVESAGLTGNAKSLWKLDSVLLQPAAKRP